MLTAIPIILSDNSIKELTRQPFIHIFSVDFNPSEALLNLLRNVQVLTLNAETGYLDNGEFVYSILANTELNELYRNQIISFYMKSRQEKQDEATEVEQCDSAELGFKTSKMEYIIEKMRQQTNKILLITGSYRCERIMERLDFKQYEKVFIYPANNIITTIPFINKYLAGAKAYINKMNQDYVFYVKKDNIILFQPIVCDISSYVNRLIAEKVLSIQKICENQDLPLRKKDILIIEKELYFTKKMQAVHKLTLKDNFY